VGRILGDGGRASPNGPRWLIPRIFLRPRRVRQLAEPPPRRVRKLLEFGQAARGFLACFRPAAAVVQLSYCSYILREAALLSRGAARRGGVLPHLPRHPQCSLARCSQALGLFFVRLSGGSERNRALHLSTIYPAKRLTAPVRPHRGQPALNRLHF
jgi:hypothetical protein